ncbi:icarapin-like isoform X1 [Apis dorsata]|uniref:icarapin-like isoform X1 n=1 Tax=Apis dorsata TaxID=7462 RepID=UPI0003DF7FD9|nr:icarapin-like isoform X1 [Apis dorsata]
MKTLGVLFIAAWFIACTHSFPGARDEDSKEERKNVDTVLILPSHERDQMMAATFDFPSLSFEDSDESSNWNWNTLLRPNFLDGWYQTLQSAISAHMKKVREQMAGILSRIPEQGVVNWNKIPEGANTTSTTKIIDGHVVTINETTYTDGSDDYSTLIRVRVIDVRPQNETILTTVSSEADSDVTTLPTLIGKNDTSTQSSRSVESVEDFDNEIPKNQGDVLTA